MTGKPLDEKVDVLRQHYPNTAHQRPVLTSARRISGSNMQQSKQQRNQENLETIAEMSRRAMENPNTAAGNAFYSEQT